MSEKSAKVGTWISSSVGIVLFLAVVIALNYLAGFFPKRFDLTEQKIYTLSEGTQRVLSRLEHPVTLRFYISQQSEAMPLSLKDFGSRVEDLLTEYVQASGGMVRVEKLDPVPDSDAEDAANLDGVRGQPTPSGDNIYLGLSVRQLERDEAIGFLSPARERLLEYDVTRAITRVSTDTKRVIGLMSGVSINGAPAMQPGAAPRPPWIFAQELREDYEVVDLELDVPEIPENIDVLIALHPSKISERTEYALDRFVRRGGKLIALLDPLSIVQAMEQPQNPMGVMLDNNSTLPKLLPAWGIDFLSEKVAADLTYKSLLQGPSGQPVEAPAVLSLNAEAVNLEEVVTNQIDNMALIFSGVFEGEPVEGLTKTVLLHTSENSQLIDTFQAQNAGEELVKNFEKSGQQYALAISLQGRFPQAFPDGPPPVVEAEKSAEDDVSEVIEEEEEEEADEVEEIAPDEAAVAPSSSTEGVVILVGDADFLFDNFAVQKSNFFGQTIVQPLNSNLSFMQNAVEYLAGDSDLIAVRSRGSVRRPFVRINAMQAEAEEKYRAKIQELETSLEEANEKLQQLQATSSEDGQELILSAEQEAEIAKFNERRVEINRELKQVRRDLRKEIDSLQDRLTWANILAIPVFIILLGLIRGWIFRKRSAAS